MLKTIFSITHCSLFVNRNRKKRADLVILHAFSVIFRLLRPDRLGCAFLEHLVELLDVVRDVAAEYRRACDDDVCAGCNDVCGVVQLCAAVDLKLALIAVLLDLPRGRP